MVLMLYGYISVCIFGFNLFCDLADWWFPPDVYASIHCNPHTAVNISHSSLKGYTVMMFLFGFLWGCINTLVVCVVVFPIFEDDTVDTDHKVNDKGVTTTQCFFKTLIMILIVISSPVLILGPFFSPWIALPLAQKVCDIQSSIVFV